MNDNKNKVKLTALEIRLSKMVQKYIRDNKLTLDRIRTGRQQCDLPIGSRSLFTLVKRRGNISLNLQIKLIEFFGLEWELQIKQSTT